MVVLWLLCDVRKTFGGIPPRFAGYSRPHKGLDSTVLTSKNNARNHFHKHHQENLGLP